MPYRKDSHHHFEETVISYRNERSSVISKRAVPLIRNSCRSGNHHAELVIYHFERYNIYHCKTKSIFSYPIRVSTMESSCDAPQCMLPKREWRHIHTSRTTPIHGHGPLRSPQLRLRSVGIFITIKIPYTSVLLHENKILVSRLLKPASIILSDFRTHPYRWFRTLLLCDFMGLGAIFVCKT